MKALCCKNGLGLIWELPIFIAWSKQESDQSYESFFSLVFTAADQRDCAIPADWLRGSFPAIDHFLSLRPKREKLTFSVIPPSLWNFLFLSPFSKFSSWSLGGLRKFSLNDVMGRARVGPTFKGCRIYIRLRRLRRRPQVQLRTIESLLFSVRYKIAGLVLVNL